MTMEFQSLPPEPCGRAAEERRGIRRTRSKATRRSISSMSPAEARQLDSQWRGTFDLGAKQGQTIRQRETITGFRSSLPVKSRYVREKRKAAGDAAEVAGRSARLRAARHHRRRRHGRRLRGPSIVDRPHRRREDAQAVGQGPRRAARQVHLRSGRHRRARPSEHRADLRPRRERRRRTVLLDEARPRHALGQGDPPEAARRKPEHPAARGRRGGVRPRRRRDPSRPEAGKRHARRLRRSAGDGLGPGADHARVRPRRRRVPGRQPGRHAGLHGAGNGQGPGRERSTRRATSICSARSCTRSSAASRPTRAAT